MPGSTEYGTAPAPWLNHAQAGQSAHVGGSQAPDAGVAGAAGSHLARTPLQPQSGQQQQQQQQQQQESSKKKKRRTDGDNIDEKRTKTGRACDACVSVTHSPPDADDP
jgi:hypothetical protein